MNAGWSKTLARELAPDHGVALSRQVGAEAERAGLLALAQSARIREIDCLLRANGGVEAASLAQTLLERLPHCHPSDLYLAEAWWVAYQALEADPQRRGKAREALQRGTAWIRDVAARHVPDEFRDSFLNRNAVNRSLLASATRT